MSGINSLTGRIILLDEFKFDFTPGQIRKFVKMWDEGQPISKIAEYFYISMDNVAVMVMHCTREGWIQPREGGLLGNKQHERPPRKIKIQG
jgi:hypothetical protein